MATKQNQKDALNTVLPRPLEPTDESIPLIPPHPGTGRRDDWHPTAVRAWVNLMRSPSRVLLTETDPVESYLVCVHLWALALEEGRERAALDWSTRVGVYERQFLITPQGRRGAKITLAEETPTEAPVKSTRRRSSEDPRLRVVS